MARITDPNDFLIHYGIPGMKWGKHKAKANNASPSAMRTHTPFEKNPNKAPPLAKGVTDLRPKHIKRISDTELRNRINRMQMETQYKQLIEGKSAPDKSKAKVAYENFEKGHRVTQKVLAVAKTAQAIHKFANSELVKDISKLLAETSKK
jgi:hypothetical protein